MYETNVVVYSLPKYEIKKKKKKKKLIRGKKCKVEINKGEVR